MGKIITKNELPLLRKECTEAKKKIALANGCFDILHPGHFNYLREAKKLADVLVVAVNSDDSVRKIKGANRPIFNDKERAEMLSSIIYVDYVVIFEEDDVSSIIKALKPDYHCKGEDYTIENIPEKEISDELRVQTVILGGPKIYSSSELIKKIIGDSVDR